MEGLQHLLEAEWLDRAHRRVQRLRKAAGSRYQAGLEELTYKPSRGLEKKTLLCSPMVSTLIKGKLS